MKRTIGTGRRLMDYRRSTTAGEHTPAVKPKLGCRECGEITFHLEKCRIRPWAPSRFVKDEERKERE